MDMMILLYILWGIGVVTGVLTILIPYIKSKFFGDYLTSDDLRDYMAKDKNKGCDGLYETFITKNTCAQHQLLIKQVIENQGKDLSEIKDSVKEIKDLTVAYLARKNKGWFR